MARKPMIGVMGPGEGASEKDMQTAFELGKMIAEKGWILLSGGRNKGVMDSVNKGAKSVQGVTVALSPEKDTNVLSDAVDIAIVTGMGSARNNINVLSSNVVIACGEGGAGTASEIALALKAKRPVVLLNADDAAVVYFKKLGGDAVHVVSSPAEAMASTERLLHV